MEKILPKTFHGWKLSGEPERYSPKNLFDYINGGAELYLSFGFKELYVARFHKDKAPPFEVDLFDMGSSEDAFGVFRHDLEDEDVGIGQGSEYGGSWLRFWKGQYYVYIYSEGEGTSTKEALLGLGRKIAERIETPGAKPDLVNKIPKQGVIPKSLRFFHNHASLNYYYYIASENILHLSEKTNGIFVKYSEGEHKVPLILIEYLNPTQADTAYNDFLANYLPEAKREDVIQTENGKWAGGIPHGQYLIIVLDA
ncbi:MAG: DUF6599 family protein, partial [Thermodesulfobacteriota bacterium]|nr:DUF6599 family protein [Thermodesulfobacteriota bacterium]